MKLLVPAILRRYSEGLEEVSVEGATVAEALEDLFGKHAGLRERVLAKGGGLQPYLLVFCNAERAELETSLVEGDVVEIVAAAEGG